MAIRPTQTCAVTKHEPDEHLLWSLPHHTRRISHQKLQEICPSACLRGAASGRLPGLLHVIGLPGARAENLQISDADTFNHTVLESTETFFSRLVALQPRLTLLATNPTTLTSLAVVNLRVGILPPLQPGNNGTIQPSASHSHVAGTRHRRATLETEVAAHTAGIVGLQCGGRVGDGQNQIEENGNQGVPRILHTLPTFQ
ncbi:hypothetical protein B0T25DRAFT_124223 [Lasiosphaeria hispida]|uniref:Uncharacterized protein n=1 Tax=Lasiosphaeria hispida TaxID=260671 RepID=A0AAJ0HS09_9PEZI|nr:hypothetical protein B0T25DRAFT_124223 [Lasiosphaeria hispida]